MRKKRFGKLRKEKREVAELDITSLLDILVILLVFLLKSYNASDLKLDLVENLRAAPSKSRTLGGDFTIVQINKNMKIWVDRKEVGSINGTSSTINQLLTALKVAKEAKPDVKQVNLVFDKSLKYKTIRKVMHTAAMAGYPQFKLIVQGAEG